MNEKTDLWQRVLHGDDSVDFLELSGLIAPDSSETFLWAQFGTLPNAASMIERVLELQRDNRIGTYITPDRAHYKPKDEIERLAQAWRCAVQKYLQLAGEDTYAHDLQSQQIEWIYNNADFLKLSQDDGAPVSAASEYMSKVFSDYYWAKEPWGVGLKEAALHLTTYPAITRWLLEDVFGFPMKSRGYYELWRAGGDVIFMRGYMVVLCEAGQS